MPRSRFFWRLCAVYVALILVTTLTVGVLVSRWIARESLSETENALRAQTALLHALAQPALSGTPGADFQRLLVQLGQSIDTRLTVIRADGVVIADSHEDPTQMENHQSRPEIQDAFFGRSKPVVRHSSTIGTDMMYYALDVRQCDQIIGYARAAIPLSLIDRRLGQIRRLILLGAGIAALVGLLLGLYFARQVTEPLRHMAEVARAIAAGDYDQRVRMQSRDEFGQLATAFNTMAAQLRERMEMVTRDRNKLIAVLAGMVEGVVAIDQDERILHINDVARRLLGVPRDGGVGKPIWEVTRLHEINELLGLSMHEARDITVDLSVPLGARDAVIGIHASPLRTGEGQVAGALVVLHDVTELRRLEAVRRDFVANVSHELKTPLTAIRGMVETLLDHEGMDPARARRFLAKILDQATQMASLVNDLLTLSRVESPGSLLNREPIDLREQAEASARNLRPTAEAKSITLEVETPDSRVGVLGDEKALQQIVGNLLDNAIKYTPDGGRIWLRVRSEHDTAVIEVQDTGIGIEPRDQDRIFERFYRVDKGRSRALGGTGLGLSIVKHVVSGLGGEVSVESRPGEGSTFRVKLPLISAKTATS